MEPFEINDTIAAISTPPGVGGIAVIRVSGPKAIAIVNSAWKGADLSKALSHTVHLGRFYSTEGNLLDEAVATVFLAPASFTGENVVEISVHGSTWIQKEVLNDLVKRGARIANPGEFTQRAFLNGKLDLAQAEGVADLIASSSKASHDLAISQTRGKFSQEFEKLRQKLIEFASLLELELDFSEEDVEFADRSALLKLCDEVLKKVNSLADSYSRGAVLKEGVPVVIAGVPNAGKSSVLNLLLNDDKAIVTDIPGTTRDTIEDTAEFNGILYRFIDTAGIRETTDTVEAIGVDRALSALEKAYIIIWVIDLSYDTESQLSKLNEFQSKHPSKPIIVLLNKADLEKPGTDLTPISLDIFKEVSLMSKDKASDSSITCNPSTSTAPLKIIFSTITRQGLPELLSGLHAIATANANPEYDVIITNARHYEALTKASQALVRARYALSPSIVEDPNWNLETPTESSTSIDSTTSFEEPISGSMRNQTSASSGNPTSEENLSYNKGQDSIGNLTTKGNQNSFECFGDNGYLISADFIAQDIREAISHLASITGEISSDTLLHSIFSRFCIGK